MDKEFKQGQKLDYVQGPSDSDGNQVFYRVGYSYSKSVKPPVQIEVVMEYGQMAGVPWALVTFENKPPVKVNLALMEEVGLLEESEGQNA